MHFEYFKRVPDEVCRYLAFSKEILLFVKDWSKCYWSIEAWYAGQRGIAIGWQLWTGYSLN